MTSAPRVLIMAGGTGGHVFPALAVARVLQSRGWLIDWIGTDRGLEARVVPAHDFNLHVMPVQGLRGKSVWFRVKSFYYLLASFVAAIRLIIKLRPQAVLGLGGYVAGPAGVAARLLGRPLVIHEQNAVAGTTNRWLAPLATRVLFGLPGAFADETGKSWVGNPVRPEIVALHRDEAVSVADFSSQRPLRLLVVGGSLGSSPLNAAVPAAVRGLAADRVTRLVVRHQCGAQDVEKTRAGYGDGTGVQADVTAFIEDMADAYRWADLVISRAGALTVSELAVAGRAAILVPLPHAIDDHQTENARVLSTVGGAQLLPQDGDLATKLNQLLAGFIATPARLSVIAGNARKLAMPDAAAVVADVVEEVADVA